MRVHELEEQLMINHITEQLHELNYHETEGKSRRELTNKLATLRAMEVKVESPHSSWF